MFELISGPVWFHGLDTAIDVLSAVVLLLIALASYQYYRLNSEQGNYFHLAVAFALMAVAFGAKALIYWFTPVVVSAAKPGLLLIPPEALFTSPRFYAFFLGYRFVLVFALYWLYTIYQYPSRMNVLLVTYLLMVAVFSSRASYTVFHFTVAMLTFLITATYLYRYKFKGVPATRLVALSFGLFCLSSVAMLFIFVSPLMYVAAQTVQLVAFVTLLFTFIRILYHGKKTLTY